MSLILVPITLKEASSFVAEHHRHHRPPQGGRFAVAAWTLDQSIVGVAIVGRPVSRGLQDGWTAEVTRLCTSEIAPKNVCSFLYAACWRACRAMGFRRLVTYTLKSEAGTSLRAAGWREIGSVKGRSWHCASRPRVDKHPTEDKTLWEAAAS